MTTKYIKEVTRMMSLFDVKAWHEGQSIELKKLMGVGFFNHLFISQAGVVTLYYDGGEGEAFYIKLKEILTDDFFDDVCDDFIKLTLKIDEVNTNKEVFDLSSKMMPALIIFDEVDNYPEIASDYILRRLMRIRTSTESLSYELAKKVKLEEQPKDFIFYKGKIYSFL